MQNSMVLFSFWAASFVQNKYLAFWCYLMNLPSVYSKRLEASGFSCSYTNKECALKLIKFRRSKVDTLCTDLFLQMTKKQLNLICKKIYLRRYFCDQNEILANFCLLKLTSATKLYFLKMCHLRHRLNFFLFHRKLMFRSQDI